MTPTTHTDFYDQVASMRSKVFDLMDEVSSVRNSAFRSGCAGLASNGLSSAAAGMQSVANELGNIEALVSSQPTRRFPA